MATQNFGVAGGGYNNFRGVNISPYSVGSSVAFATDRVVQQVSIQMAGATSGTSARGVLWNSTGSVVLAQSANTAIAIDNTPPFSLKDFNIPNTYVAAGTYYVGFWRDSTESVNWDVQNGNNTSKTSGGSGAGSSAGALDSSGSGTVYRRLIGRITYIDVVVPGTPTFNAAAGTNSIAMSSINIVNDGSNASSPASWAISWEYATKISSATTWTTWTAFNPTVSNTHSITGLTPGTTYNVKIRSRNPVGYSPESEIKTVTPYGVASVTAATLTYDSGTNSNTIAYSANRNYGTISTVRIDRSVNGAAYTTLSSSITAPAPDPSTNQTISGSYVDSASIIPGATYAYRVYVTSQAGLSAFRTTNTVTTITKPSAPRNFATTSINPTSIGVSWAAPSDTGGSAIQKYTLYIDSTQLVPPVNPQDQVIGFTVSKIVVQDDGGDPVDGYFSTIYIHASYSDLDNLILNTLTNYTEQDLLDPGVYDQAVTELFYATDEFGDPIRRIKFINSPTQNLFNTTANPNLTQLAGLMLPVQGANRIEATGFDVDGILEFAPVPYDVSEKTVVFQIWGESVIYYLPVANEVITTGDNIGKTVTSYLPPSQVPVQSRAIVSNNISPSTFSYNITTAYDSVNNLTINIEPNTSYSLGVFATNTVLDGTPATLAVTTIGGIPKIYINDEWVYAKIKKRNATNDGWDNAYIKVRNPNNTDWTYI